MTRNEAKELLPIVQAFAEGKPIEVFINNQWMDLPEDADLRPMMTKYRIKPTPEYRPFNDAEECWTEMLKHQPFGWIKNGSGGLLMNIITIGAGITVHNNISNCGYSFKTAFSLRFADGTPFGIKEE